jgi:O-antigen/teichoic acid export membrane protein
MNNRQLFDKLCGSMKRGGDGRKLLVVVGEQIGLRGINFATFVIVARNVDLADMGMISLAWTVLYFIEALMSGGIALACIQHQTSNAVTKSTFFWICVISGIIGFLLMCAAGVTGEVLLDYSDFSSFASFIGVIYLLRMLGGSHQMILVREQKQSALAVRTLVAAALSAFLGIYLALNGLGIWALLWRNAIESALKTALCIACNYWKPLWCFDRVYSKEIIGRALPLIVSAVGKLVIHSSQQIAITSTLGLNILGGVEVARRLPVMVKQSSDAIIGRFSLPYFSERYRKGWDSEILILSSARLGVVISLFCMIALYFLKDLIIEMIFGFKWMAFSDLFYVLMIHTIASLFIAYFKTILIAYASFKATALDFIYMLASLPLFLWALLYSVTLSYLIVGVFQCICAVHLYLILMRKLRMNAL